MQRKTLIIKNKNFNGLNKKIAKKNHIWKRKEGTMN